LDTALVIIPAFNEGPRIGIVVDSIKEILPMTEILVVDDNSKDNTREQAQRAGAYVITHPINLGYASSLETGYRYALKYHYDYVIQMDGDGQHLAGEIPKLLGPLTDGKADIVIGSRIKNNPGYSIPSIRRLGLFFFSNLFYIFTCFRINDPTSGFQGLNKKTLSLYLNSTFPDDFPDTDVLLQAYLCGLRIIEIPVRMQGRSGGISMHSGLKPIYYTFKMTLSMIITYINYKSKMESKCSSDK